MKISSIEKIQSEPVYDITVAGEHHYILENGLITHNSGGGGLKYAASIIAFLSKSKKLDTENKVSGAVITIKIDKSRFTREEKKTKTLLDHSTGLNRYYGLIDIGLESGVLKKLSNKIQFPNVKGVSEKAVFESVVYKNPEKWFTKEVLDLIDEGAGRLFKYGSEDADVVPEVEEEEEEA